MVFVNNSSKNVIIKLYGEESIIPPRQTITFKSISGSQPVIALKCQEDSKYYKNRYILNIETEYLCNDYSEEVFFINREKIRVGLNVCYERLFLSTESMLCECISYTIPDETQIKKTYNRRRLFDFLFISPIENTTELFVGAIILGIVLTHIINWKYILIYSLLCYILLLTINFFGDKLINVIFKKIDLNWQDEKTEFYSFFDNCYITNYYSNLNRVPFMGEIEIN